MILSQAATGVLWLRVVDLNARLEGQTNETPHHFILLQKHKDML
jgi:hypothetical protein